MARAAELALQQTKASRKAASGRILFDALAAELSVGRTSSGHLGHMAQQWNAGDTTGVLDPGWNGSGFADHLAHSYWLELSAVLASIALAEIRAGNVPTQILRNHQRGIVLLAFDRGPLVSPPAVGVIVHTGFQYGNYCYDGTKCTYEDAAHGSFLAFDDPLWAPEE